MIAFKYVGSERYSKESGNFWSDKHVWHELYVRSMALHYKTSDINHLSKQSCLGTDIQQLHFPVGKYGQSSLVILYWEPYKRR